MMMTQQGIEVVFGLTVHLGLFVCRFVRILVCSGLGVPRFSIVLGSFCRG